MMAVGAPRSWTCRGYGEAAISTGNFPCATGRYTSASRCPPPRNGTCWSTSRLMVCSAADRLRYSRPVVCRPLNWDVSGWTVAASGAAGVALKVFSFDVDDAPARLRAGRKAGQAAIGGLRKVAGDTLGGSSDQSDA